MRTGLDTRPIVVTVELRSSASTGASHQSECVMAPRRSAADVVAAVANQLGPEVVGEATLFRAVRKRGKEELVEVSASETVDMLSDGSTVSLAMIATRDNRNGAQAGAAPASKRPQPQGAGVVNDGAQPVGSTELALHVLFTQSIAAPAPLAKAPPEWACDSCTFLCPASTSTCEMCGAANQHPIPQEQSSKGPTPIATTVWAPKGCTIGGLKVMLLSASALQKGTQASQSPLAWKPAETRFGFSTPRRGLFLVPALCSTRKPSARFVSPQAATHRTFTLRPPRR